MGPVCKQAAKTKENPNTRSSRTEVCSVTHSGIESYSWAAYSSATAERINISNELDHEA
jgi:hypothetical protein